jgi:hypothetical protein
MDSFKFLKNFFDLKAYDIDGEIVLKLIKLSLNSVLWNLKKQY